MKSTLYILVIIAAGFGLSSARALTPPLPAESLLKDADLVVEGKVLGPLVCEARVEQNSCADKFRYYTPLEIQKVLKGDANIGEILRMAFVHYDYKSGCVGDQGPSVQNNQSGTYYLKKDGKGGYDLWHWSALKVKAAGSGELPGCK
jgi:hypothetical protein